MNDKIKDNVAHALIKEKISIAGGSAPLVTGVTSVQLNAKANKNLILTVNTNTLDKMRCQANLSLNQTQNITGTIRKDLGRSLFPQDI